MFSRYGIENHLIFSASSFQQSKQFGGCGAWQFPIREWVGEGRVAPGQAVGGFLSKTSKSMKRRTTLSPTAKSGSPRLISDRLDERSGVE
jgi:hypothetical protein